ncbi:MAG: hypothetical protein ACFFD1_06200 [Candidatus Thorarchaeota archaeon]
MTTLTNQKKRWTKDEEKLLKKEYNKKNLDINEIAKIHKRTPRAIAYKLENLGIVGNMKTCRGFNNMEKQVYKKPATIKSLFDDIHEIKELLIEFKQLANLKDTFAEKNKELENNEINLDDCFENQKSDSETDEDSD